MAHHLLLISGVAATHRKAKALGLRLTLFKAADRVKVQKHLDMYDRIVGLPQGASLEEWIEMARAIHRLDPVDAIGGFSETAQEKAALIAEALNLPFYAPAVIRRTRNKAEMRAILRAAGLDSTPSQVVAAADEIVAFGADHGYPLILKPLDGLGSLAVAIVRSPDTVAGAFAQVFQRAGGAEILVEGFLEGPEYSVEAFSEHGRHRVICVTQKFKDPRTCIETGHCVPAPISDRQRAAIECFVMDVLEAMEMTHGPSHTEVVVTADGPKIVETHARLGGDNIVDLIKLTGEVDLEELWIRQSSGESVFDQLPAALQGYAAIAYATPQAIGVLERIDGLEAARGQPGVIRVEPLQDPGTMIEGAYDSYSRGASAIAVGDSYEEAVSRAQTAVSQLRFIVTCAG
ncbi:MAG TPA: ATP-grasp domain-containing protein [Herpetosiphonaceae bacterium]|nr:ATP-grasp domain-containing protein [Herpetosiphonaceae bacterium]